MATFVIGDLHGCSVQLENLLSHIKYKPSDKLIFVGDIINGGPSSLKTLLRVIELCKIQGNECLLGNHELYLLAVLDTQRKHISNRKYGINDILQYTNKHQLIDWLRQRPLLIKNNDHNALIVHAGLHPTWNSVQAIEFAQQIETKLREDNWQNFLANILMHFDNASNAQPEANHQKMKYYLDVFLHMRYLDAAQNLVLEFKSAPISYNNKDIFPWFELDKANNRSETVLFGHWSSLGGLNQYPHYVGVDYGCVWGGKLAAFCLDDATLYSVAGLS